MNTKVTIRRSLWGLLLMVALAALAFWVSTPDDSWTPPPRGHDGQRYRAADPRPPMRPVAATYRNDMTLWFGRWYANTLVFWGARIVSSKSRQTSLSHDKPHLNPPPLRRGEAPLSFRPLVKAEAEVTPVLPGGGDSPGAVATP
jgi:hypothetical protein